MLCTGTTGSGKSTTLAAMIDHINATRNEHVMTIEDPIEFLHRDKKSIVNQREVDVDTKGFSLALRSALRQDPDVILVGEMRDYETIETALTAAETGHLVFSTLHTLDATETINRIISVFPPHQQKQIRLQLGAVLKAAVSLRLMPRADGLGRVPAAEILIRTNYVRECIENKEKTKYIKDAIQQGTSQYGMQTFDQSLYSLYKSGLITLEEALKRATNPNEFKLKIQGIQSTADMAREEMDSVARGAVGLQPAAGGVALRLLQPDPAGKNLDGRTQAEVEPPGARIRASAARERALRLLSIRSRGRAELVRALQDRGFAAGGRRRSRRASRDGRPARRSLGGALGGADARRAPRPRTDRARAAGPRVLEGDDRRGARGGRRLRPGRRGPAKSVRETLERPRASRAAAAAPPRLRRADPARFSGREDF